MYSVVGFVNINKRRETTDVVVWVGSFFGRREYTPKTCRFFISETTAGRNAFENDTIMEYSLLMSCTYLVLNTLHVWQYGYNDTLDM